APAVPAFSAALAGVRAAVAASRADGLKALAGDQAARVDALTADLNWRVNDVQTQRWQGQSLRSRLDAQRPGRTKPNDPGLIYDVQRFAQDFQTLAGRVDQDVSEARAIRSAVGAKSPDLAQAAQNLDLEAQRLKDEVQWMSLDLQDLGWSMRDAGYSFEAFDVENSIRSLTNDSDGLKTAADGIVAASR
ncbi:MAG: hypothetical protein KGM24_03425, partial [Elusimicrobia bacterium]|nr:hypothetical protein [Elusimicrobiota bacterium]